MASLSNDPGGYRRIIVLVDGKRRTIRLGKLTEERAATIRDHVSALAEAKGDGSPPPSDTSRWLARLDDRLRDKLVRIGLAEPREREEGLTVGGLIDAYKKNRFGTLRRGTQLVNEQAFAAMRMLLGSETPIERAAAP